MRGRYRLSRRLLHHREDLRGDDVRRLDVQQEQSVRTRQLHLGDLLRDHLRGDLHDVRDRALQTGGGGRLVGWPLRGRLQRLRT
jgi:hypothetical protein